MSPARRQQKPLDVNEWKKWDQKSKDKFLAKLQDSERPKRVWYCKTPGRKCDGKPHKGYDYPHARSDQWPPAGKDWDTWLLKGGRGSGKTRSGSEWVRVMAHAHERGSIIGPTVKHVRSVMVEGDSGLLAVFAAAKVHAVYEPSKQQIVVPCECKPGGILPLHLNGHIIQLFTGDEPERLRGPQHAYVWLDEPAHFKLIDAVWDNMQFGLRLGTHPVVLCSTTPLPTKWMKELIADEGTISVTVSTYANMDNLAPKFKKVMLKKYEGTRLGRQELHGEVLDDIKGALWTWAMIDDDRIVPTVDEDGNLVGGIKKEDMDRIVVSIDPAGTSSKKRDETGITVIGRKGDHYYVLADYSDHYTPDGWAKKAWYAYDLWEADLIVAEKNYGGEMVLSTLRNVREDGKVDLVTSRRGKELRAEPVVGLYEQHRVHHTANFGELEQQMCEWVPGASDSPDRVDALVHGVVKLSEGGGATSVSVPSGNIGRPPIGSAGRIGQLRFSDIADSAVLRGGHSAA
jgi:phage terminase large subunit-like protein